MYLDTANKWRRHATSLAVVMLILSSGAFAQAQSDSGEEAKVSGQEVLEVPELVLEFDGLLTRLTKAQHTSKYRLGVHLLKVSDLLRSHLELPEGQGMVVVEVMPNTPAAEANLQSHDILVKVGNAIASDQAAIAKAVDAAEGNELALEIIRAGERLTVKVTPRKRSATGEGEAGTFEVDFDWDKVIEAGKANKAGQGMAFRLWPGIIGDRTAHLDFSKMPMNLLVTIKKEGAGPAKVSIERKRDGKTESWEVTEKNVDELPEDIRGFAKSIVNRGSGAIQITTLPHQKWMAAKQAALAKAFAQMEMQRPSSDGANNPNQSQLEALSRQVQELANEVRKLRDDASKD